MRPSSPIRLKMAFIALMVSAFHWLPLAKAARVQDTASIGASFDAFWAAARDRPFDEQEAAWDKLIEQPRQDIYASVVWECRDKARWREEKEQSLRQRFGQYPRVSGQISTTARELQSAMRIQVTRFRKLFPDAPARPSIQLLLAPNFDAKSGVLSNGAPVLVFAVDSLVLEKADMSILFPHELFHLYHALHAGIENDGVMPGADLTLPLFAEGLATYVSSVLSPGHSDGQLLLQESLGAIPLGRLPELARRFLSDADDKAVNALGPKGFGRWFMGANKNYQADVPNRTGYWLGLNVIRQMQRQYTVQEMSSWSASKAQEMTRTALSTMARGELSQGDVAAEFHSHLESGNFEGHLGGEGFGSRNGLRRDGFSDRLLNFALGIDADRF
jgi:hypothetical protein